MNIEIIFFQFTFMHLADAYIQSELQMQFVKEPTIFVMYNARFIKQAREEEKCMKEKVL